jgi:hypothetical protein
MNRPRQRRRRRGPRHRLRRTCQTCSGMSMSEPMTEGRSVDLARGLWWLSSPPCSPSRRGFAIGDWIRPMPPWRLLLRSLEAPTILKGLATSKRTSVCLSTKGTDYARGRSTQTADMSGEAGTVAVCGRAKVRFCMREPGQWQAAKVRAPGVNLGPGDASPCPVRYGAALPAPGPRRGHHRPAARHRLSVSCASRALQGVYPLTWGSGTLAPVG